jgi:single-strand DNA-binding protein
MANLNKVMLIGRLTRDPEVIPTRGGGKGMKFGFAVNNRKKDQTTNQWVDEPVFIDMEVWNRGENGRQADLVEQSLRKGHQVFIEGHLRLDKWVDKKDGSNRTKLAVVVDNFQFLEPRSDGGGAEGGGRPLSRPAPAPRRQESSYSGGNGGQYDDPPEPDIETPAPRGGGADEEIPF